jgi:ABC-type multidrug transport system fused ATPase/permease subunit
MGLVS